jgi:hypothetical protein
MRVSPIIIVLLAGCLPTNEEVVSCKTDIECRTGFRCDLSRNVCVCTSAAYPGCEKFIDGGMSADGTNDVPAPPPDGIAPADVVVQPDSPPDVLPRTCRQTCPHPIWRLIPGSPTRRAPAGWPAIALIPPRDSVWPGCARDVAPACAPGKSTAEPPSARQPEPLLASAWNAWQTVSAPATRQRGSA